jgi:hypothetical protein
MAGPTGPTGPGLQLVQSPLFYNAEFESLSIDLSAYATETYVDVAVSQVDVTSQLQEVQIATIMGAY